MLENIPAELRGLNQWIVWRYEKRGEKLTKVPYCPRAPRTLASVTDPSTWGSFADAVACRDMHRDSLFIEGTGFVFTPNDPYTGIDFDASDDPETNAKQQQWLHQFASYNERSPSGRGLHIIVKGHVEGRRTGKFEVYSEGRFFTMTGDVFIPAPIREAQAELLGFVQELNLLRPKVAVSNHASLPQTEEDIAIHTRAASAANGPKFSQLWAGDWQGAGYSSQSEADFALIDILGFYSYNFDQVARLFRMSGLGQRDKASRDDYVFGMVKRAADRRPDFVDFSNLADAMRDAQPEAVAEPAIEPATPPALMSQPVTSNAQTSTDDIAWPPGLIGEIAQFVYDAAPRPVRIIALATALGIMSGICGRGYNVSGTGLNQYILILGKTGTGKEVVQTGFDKLMSAVCETMPSANTFIGPAEAVSGPGLLKWITENPCCLQVTGEFGLRLQAMSGKHAPAHEVTLRRTLLDLFGKSGRGSMLRASAYSDKDKNGKVIVSPAYSLMGESTPETFYGGLDEQMIADGLLPRFLIIEYDGQRVYLNENAMYAVPSAQLVANVKAVCQSVLSRAVGNQVINVQMTPGALEMFRAFDKETTDAINSDGRAVVQQLWNRADLKAKKLAALIAVSWNPHNPMITEDAVAWALDFERREIARILHRFQVGDVGDQSGNELAQMLEVRRCIRTYFRTGVDKLESYKADVRMRDAGIVPRAYLQRRLYNMAAFRNDRQGAGRALDRAIKNLMDGDELKTVPEIQMSAQFSTTTAAYFLPHPRIFMADND